MENPLSILQKYVIGKKAIIMRDGYIHFGNECSWPENVKTNWMIYGSGKNGAFKEYYTLKSLVFFLQKISYQHGVYVREAVNENIPAVRRPDRRGLLSYLRGEIATSESIDKLAQPENIAPTKPALVLSTIPQVGEVRKHEDDDAKENIKKARLQADTEKLKAQLAVKLSDIKENCVMTDDLKSLSEAMTVERIAAIKAKRLAKKRTMIKNTVDEDLGGESEEMGAAISLGNDDILKDILARERVWKSRKNMLQSISKDFATNVFAILDNVKERESSKKPDYKPTPIGSNTSAAKPMSRSAVVNHHQRAYNRYDQERFTKQEETTSGFTIQTTASYHGSTIQALISGQKPQIMQPPKAPAQPTAAAVPRPKKRPSTTPIIIVPSSVLSLITTLNVTDVLQDLHFVSNDEKRASGKKKESDLLIQRRKAGGLTVPYRIMDNPLRLNAEEWQRVVAVFVLGPTWQFKGWPVFGANPVDIFSNISAFHLKYDDMPVDANVGRWAVTVLNISRTKRHLDKATLLQFWETLDKQTIKKRTHLRL